MRKVGMLVVLVLGLVVSACGGSSGGGGGSSADPAGAVNLLVTTMVARQWDKIPALLCTAKRDELAAKFDLSKAMSAAPSGVDTGSILQSLTLAVKDLVVTKKSESGDNAVVSVKGSLTMSMPDDKLKDYVKVLMGQSGQTPTDEQINQMLTVVKDGLAKGTAIDSDVDVVKEGSAWLVCSDFTSGAGG
jgi:hypothetical protein